MRTLLTCLLAGAVCCFTGCYYRAEHKQTKTDGSFLSEAEAEALIEKRLEEYGIETISNMKLKRDGVGFTADGYDRDIRVGFEYRSHEGHDFENDPGGNPEGLTEAEIETLRKRQDAFREYFLIVPEGNRDEVEQAVKKFIKDLYSWEVLKKAKAKKTDSLFPEKDAKRDNPLPWESTGNLKKKRKEMERREEESKSGSQGDDDVWNDDFTGSGKSSDVKSSGRDSKDHDEDVFQDDGESKSSSDNDVWKDEDEDF